MIFLDHPEPFVSSSRPIRPRGVTVKKGAADPIKEPAKFHPDTGGGVVTGDTRRATVNRNI